MPSEIQQFFFLKLVLTAYTTYLNSKNICMDKNVLITEYCLSVYFILLPKKEIFFSPQSVYMYVPNADCLPFLNILRGDSMSSTYITC